VNRCGVQYSTKFKTLYWWTIFLRQHYTYSYCTFAPPRQKNKPFRFIKCIFYNYSVRSCVKNSFTIKTNFYVQELKFACIPLGIRSKMRVIFITLMNWFQNSDQILPKLLAPHKRWSRRSLENDSLLHWNTHIYNCNRFITRMRLTL
jgi:hypothetical protein